MAADRDGSNADAPDQHRSDSHGPVIELAQQHRRYGRQVWIGMVEIRDVGEHAVEDGSPGEIVPRERYRIERAAALSALRVAVCHRTDINRFADPLEYRDARTREELEPVPRNRLEHRPCVGGRAANHAQDASRSGLVLQGLLGFVEQPHILDGDHRLVRESGDQLYLLVAEWPDFPSIDGDPAHDTAVLH